MNALNPSRWSWSAGRKTLCAAALAAWVSGALADEADLSVRAPTTLRETQDERALRQAQAEVVAEIPAVTSHQAAAWTAPKLPLSWDSADPAIEWYGDDHYLAAMNNFNNGSLFRTRKELLYRDTLRLLLTKRQVRVWIRDNLHLQCEVKRWRTVDDNRELGLKLGVYYRFD